MVDCPNDNTIYEPSDCTAHTKRDGSWWEHDARGIPLCRVCPKCKATKLAKYRPEVLDDSNYLSDETIDEEIY